MKTLVASDRCIVAVSWFLLRHQYFPEALDLRRLIMEVGEDLVLSPGYQIRLLHMPLRFGTARESARFDCLR
jgi:hypothetical protein